MILHIIASAGLFYLAFPNFLSLQGFSVLSWVFAIPLFFALEDRNTPRRLWIGFLFGILANLAAVNWMIPYSLPGYFLLAFALASQAVIFAGLYRNFYSNTILNIFYVAALWTASEYLRKIMMLGESWNLAHSRTFDVAFMQIASVLGSSALSFVLIAVNYALYCVLKRSEDPKNKITAISIAVILVVIVYGYGFMSLGAVSPRSGETVRLAVLQTNHDYRGELPEEKIHAILDKNINLTREAVAMRSAFDLIVWPETAIPTDFLQDPALKEKMIRFVKEVGTNFLIGAAIRDEKGQHNSAVLLNSSGEIKEIYHKRHLIPLTEFIPDSPLWRVFAKIFNVKTPGLVEGKDSESGIMEIVLQGSGKSVRFGVAICSEDNIDKVFRDYSRRGAHFVVVLLNNGWFTQPAGFVMHGQHSLVRAVENRMPVIRSANRGLSGFIDEFGGIRAEAVDQLTGTGIVEETIVVRSEKRSGNNLHDTFCVLCVGFVILMIYSKFRRENMGKILILLVLGLFTFHGVAHAGAAVAMQKKKGAGGPPQGMPQQLPPGYVMTPEGVRKVDQQPAVLLEEPAEPVEVKDVVDLDELKESLQTSSAAWELIINPEDKEIVVQQFIDQYAGQGITIKKPAAYYAQMIDQMASGGGEMFAMPFERVLQVVAVMEYDFGNGQNPDLLAQKILGAAYEKNKQRVMGQAQQQEWSRMHQQ